MSLSYKLERNVPVYETTDVIVVGGGPAGVAAALAARRLGKSVLLIEQSAQLGGMATLGNVAVFMWTGTFTGIFKEIWKEFGPADDQQREKPTPPQFDPFLFRYYLNDKTAREGVQVLLHTTFVAAIKEESRVCGVVVHTREGMQALRGGVIIDCTGDARVAIDAGAEFTSGRPADGLTQPMTLMFSMQDTGRPVVPVLPTGCYYYEKVADLPQGRLLHFHLDNTRTLLVNMTRVKGHGAKIDDVAHAEQEALRQVFSVAHYLQRHGFPTYILSHVAAQTGVRQTNQVRGLYTLTEKDVVAGRRCDDVVAQSNYGIDIHDPTGKKECDLRRVGLYDIPYRCLVPQGLEGLLVAGRAISADHVAMSSMRVMPTCFALGQAAGVAAALAIDGPCALKDMPVTKLHEYLKKQGVEFK
jgi:hypothetical protein